MAETAELYTFWRPVLNRRPPHGGETSRGRRAVRRGRLAPAMPQPVIRLENVRKSFAMPGGERVDVLDVPGFVLAAG